MSVSSEITRISDNVSDALLAIAAKGVVIPTGSNSDDLATLIAAISSGSSIEMESGTFTPSTDYSHPTISFSKTHSAPPSFAWIAYNGFTSSSSMMAFVLFDPVALFGFPLYYNGSNTRKGAYFIGYRGTGSAATFSSGVITYGPDNTGSSDNTYYRYFATESQFKPYSGSGQRYFRSSNTFSWKAYWL